MSNKIRRAFLSKLTHDYHKYIYTHIHSSVVAFVLSTLHPLLCFYFDGLSTVFGVAGFFALTLMNYCGDTSSTLIMVIMVIM